MRDWTPRNLPGGFYCSPACGGNKGFCKKSAYDRAVRDSNKLATRMGDGWVAEVWENLGWHWRISKGVFEIHPPSGRGKDTQYSAWFQGSPQFIAYAETPEDALGFVTQDVRTAVRRIEDQLAKAA